MSLDVTCHLKLCRLKNKSVSALNVADTVDDIYLYTTSAVSTTGGII